jgi:hypothetical protein
MTIDRVIIGRVLLTVVGLFTAVAPYLADWNATHIYNPNWPPHARFHNGHTMAAATMLGLATIWFAWRRVGDRRTNIIAAGLFAALYWASQATAFVFPGVAWTAPEFLEAGQTLSQLAPQQVLEAIVLTLVAVATWLARPRPNAQVRNSDDRS